MHRVDAAVVRAFCHMGISQRIPLHSVLTPSTSYSAYLTWVVANRFCHIFCIFLWQPSSASIIIVPRISSLISYSSSFWRNKIPLSGLIAPVASSPKKIILQMPKTGPWTDDENDALVDAILEFRATKKNPKCDQVAERLSTRLKVQVMRKLNFIFGTIDGTRWFEGVLWKRRRERIVDMLESDDEDPTVRVLPSPKSIWVSNSYSCFVSLY